MSFRPSFRLNLFSSWLDHALSTVGAVVVMPFVLHTIGDRLYGIWLFIGSIAGYSGLLRLGFGTTISRYVAYHYAREEWDRLNHVFNVVLAVYCCMGLVTLFIAAIIAWLAPHLYDWTAVPLSEVRFVILILGLNVAVSIVGGAFGGVVIGVQRFDIELGISIISTVLRLSFTFGFLEANGALLTLSLILLTTTIVENLIYVVYSFAKVKTLSLGLHFLNRATLRECFSFSSYAFIQNIANELINTTDTVIIGLVLGAEAIVPYYVALRLCQFIKKPIQHIGMVSLPRAGELHANAETSKVHGLVVKTLSLSVALTVGVFIGGAFFGQTLIETWLGPGYEESYFLLLVLLGSQIIAVPVGVLRSILFGMGLVKKPALMYLVEAIANLALTLIFIHPLGLMGVALGTAIPVVAIEVGMLLPYALKQIQFDTTQLIQKVLSPLVAPLTALWVYSFIVARSYPPSVGWIEMIGVSIGGAAVLLIVWYITSRSRIWRDSSQST